jgi:probable HAF family extracellular repeat protein
MTVANVQSTAIYGINNAGVMVGSYVDSGGVRHGFRLASGKLKNIDDPNGTDTYCFGINKAGAIVGYYATTAHAAQGFMYAKGKIPDIAPPGSTGSQALAIVTTEHHRHFGDPSAVMDSCWRRYTTLTYPARNLPWVAYQQRRPHDRSVD